MIPRMRSREVLVTGVGLVNAIANDFESFVEAMRAGPVRSAADRRLRRRAACATREPARRRTSIRARSTNAGTRGRWTAAPSSFSPPSTRPWPWPGSISAAWSPCGVRWSWGSTLGGAVDRIPVLPRRPGGPPPPVPVARPLDARAGLPHVHRIRFLGPNLVFSTACTSSNLALAVACDLVRADKADVVIAGGFDPLSLISLLGLQRDAQRHPRHLPSLRSQPRRPRPRRRERGADRGSRRFAARRSARALAAIRGYGLVSDARSMTAPDPTAAGPAACMQRAIEMAGLTPAGVDLICAHGTGTVLNDQTEAPGVAQRVRATRRGDSPARRSSR